VAHDPDRLTHAEAAELLGVHPGSVARWVVEGKLRPIRPYAKAGLLRADVERLSLARWREGDPSWQRRDRDGWWGYVHYSTGIGRQHRHWRPAVELRRGQ